MVVTRDMLEAFAPEPSPAAREMRGKADRYYSERQAFDLRTWIAERLPDARERDWSEGRRWILPVCPFNDQHDRGEAYVCQMHSGAVAAGCQHESCRWTWADLRGKLEPGHAERAEERRARSDADGSRRAPGSSDREPPPEVLFEDGRFAPEIAATEAEYDRIAAQDREGDSTTTTARDQVAARAIPWRRAPDLVAEILARAEDPWITLQLATDEICRARAGATVVVIGGSGSGKSSLVACLLVEHAKNVGPAIALSIELPGEEFGARIVGQRCDASWEEALRGQVPRSEMERALALPRLYVLDRRRATIKNLERAIDAARAEHPGEPILCAIDYAQLLDSKEREARMRAADAFAQVDDVSREKRVVSIALSQMSRVSARAARQGDAIGADSSDLGAESAAIERFATLTLAIGMAAEREDGSSAVELSVGKARMGKGDRVIPMTYEGRTGLWRVAGAARAASEVREQRDVDKAQKREKATEQQMIGAVSTAKEPVTRNALFEMIGGRRADVLRAIGKLLATGEIVEVAKRATRSKSWLLWTADRARDAGAPLVRDTLWNEDK